MIISPSRFKDNFVININYKIWRLWNILSLDKEETLKVYEALLAKEKKITVLKEKHKDNQETFKAEMKALSRATNRVMKDFLGGDRMMKMHAHFKAKRENSKK